jgi:hypothetical protein
MPAPWRSSGSSWQRGGTRSWPTQLRRCAAQESAPATGPAPGGRAGLAAALLLPGAPLCCCPAPRGLCPPPEAQAGSSKAPRLLPGLLPNDAPSAPLDRGPPPPAGPCSRASRRAAATGRTQARRGRPAVRRHGRRQRQLVHRRRQPGLVGCGRGRAERRRQHGGHPHRPAGLRQDRGCAGARGGAGHCSCQGWVARPAGLPGSGGCTGIGDTSAPPPNSS